jgi:hypothetical protein
MYIPIQYLYACSFPFIDTSQVGSHLITFKDANNKASHTINKALLFAKQKSEKNFLFYKILDLHMTRQIIEISAITNICNTQIFLDFNSLCVIA